MWTYRQNYNNARTGATIELNKNFSITGDPFYYRKSWYLAVFLFYLLFRLKQKEVPTIVVEEQRIMEFFVSTKDEPCFITADRFLIRKYLSAQRNY